MSNPTSKSEAKPVDIVNWTGGRALIATGSPFDPVPYGGRTIKIGQGNNAFVFPGVGLGVLVSEAREVTESMFAAAAVRLASEVQQADFDAGMLFPPASHMRRVAQGIAEAVVKQAREDGLAGRVIPDEQIPAAVAAAMWEPEHPRMVPA
jgi:malate dehydrogenase (oxaloacetate-decarboxylating)